MPAEPSQSTTVQGFPYPGGDQLPADTYQFIRRLAEAVEKRVVGVYASTSDRDTKLSGKLEEGLVAFTKDTDRLYFYTGSQWIQFYPVVVPAILSGTTTPSNGTGSNGDIYLKY